MCIVILRVLGNELRRRFRGVGICVGARALQRVDMPASPTHGLVCLPETKVRANTYLGGNCGLTNLGICLSLQIRDSSVNSFVYPISLHRAARFACCLSRCRFFY